MTPPYRNDRDFADRYLAQQITRLASFFHMAPTGVTKAPDDKDMLCNTDIIVARPDRALRVGARVRRRYSDTGGRGHPWPQQFTVRYSRASGARTEWSKIMDGLGDLLIYSFADDDGGLEAHHIIQLDALREYVATYRAAHNGRDPGKDVPNDDGTRGRAINVADLPPGAVSSFGIELLSFAGKANQLATRLAAQRGNDKPECAQCGTTTAAVYLGMEGGAGDPRPWWLCLPCWKDGAAKDSRPLRERWRDDILAAVPPGETIGRSRLSHSVQLTDSELEPLLPATGAVAKARHEIVLALIDELICAGRLVKLGAELALPPLGCLTPPRRRA